MITCGCETRNGDFICLLQYGIKKKEVPVEDPGLEGRLGRKKKTPEELAAEANMEQDDSHSE